MLLRGMGNKANVAKITSRWLNIVGICRSERVYQNTVVQSEYFDQQNKQAS